MKYTKHFIFILLIMIFGINRVNADTTYTYTYNNKGDKIQIFRHETDNNKFYKFEVYKNNNKIDYSIIHIDIDGNGTNDITNLSSIKKLYNEQPYGSIQISLYPGLIIYDDTKSTAYISWISYAPEAEKYSGKKYFYESVKQETPTDPAATGAGNIDNTKDDYCYYYSDNLAVRVKKNSKKVLIDKVGLKNEYGNSESILNYGKEYGNTAGVAARVAIASAYDKNNECPQSIVLSNNKVIFGIREYKVFAASNESQASQIISNLNLYNMTPVSSVNTRVTQEEYYKRLNETIDWNKTIIEPNDNDDKCAIFGDVNDAGDGEDKSPSLAYMINQALGILRIIAIALVLVLGVLDFGKAVIASKEDEMKKAQSTFIKRLIMCVLIFLVPLFINIVMQLTDKYVEKFEIVNCSEK